METPVPEFHVRFPTDLPDREVVAAPPTLAIVIRRLGEIVARLPEVPNGAAVRQAVEAHLLGAAVRCHSDAVRTVDASVVAAGVHHRDADPAALRHAGVDRAAL